MRLKIEFVEEGGEDRRTILDAMKGFDKTCIRFIPRTDEKDYLLITQLLECSSHVGRDGGRQIVSLKKGSAGCMKSGVIQHELMHAIGFWHEQSRIDRDDFVEINWDNIDIDERNQFLTYTNSTAVGQPYDFGSVMDYEKMDFAKDPAIWTIQPKPQYKDFAIGQREGLSDKDIKKINLMYKCPNSSDEESNKDADDEDDTELIE